MKSFYEEEGKNLIELYNDTQRRLEVSRIRTAEDAENIVAANRPMDTRVFTGFSGADMHIIINGVTNGEILGIRYSKIYPAVIEALRNQNEYYDIDLLTEYPVVVNLIYILFSETAVLQAIENGERVDIVMRFANEYGQRREITISDLILLKHSMSHDIDQVISQGMLLMAGREVIETIQNWSDNSESN